MLPETLNFMRQVELRRSIEDEYPVSGLQRLGKLLADDSGRVFVKLSFAESVGFASLKGKVKAALMMECQRCLKPMRVEVTGTFKFAFVENEDEFDLVPDEFEPYLLEGEEQSVINIIEDELILSLPMVTVHDTDCSEYMSVRNSKIKAEIEADKEASNPFAALKDLKSDKVN